MNIITFEMKNQKKATMFFVVLFLMCFTGSFMVSGNTFKDRTGILLPQQSDTKTVTGKVTDDTGYPLPGVTILVKGTTEGTITDLDGNYSISNVLPNSVLVFSFVGMNTQEITVGNQMTIDAVMSEDSGLLEEVVVVGYGVQKKKLVTGATGQVRSEDLQKMNSTTVTGALQGQVPGVNIIQRSGEPGAQSKITIRGIGTVGNANPLYIVDGFPGVGIDNIDPANIESIDILKDAASAAIYGSRAANGVVLITTKKGVEGKTGISYNGTYSINNLRYKPEMLDAKQYLEFYSQASGRPLSYFEFVPRLDEIMDGTYKGTDWIDESSNKNAPVQTHSLNISGGGKSSVYSMMLNYTKGESMIGKPVIPEYERFSFSINSDHNVIVSSTGRNILTVGQDLSFSRWSRNGLSYGAYSGNDFTSLIQGIPILPVYDDEGEFTMLFNEWYPLDLYNPMKRIKSLRDGRENQSNSLIANGYFQIEPIENLVWRTSASARYWYNNNRNWTPAYEFSAKDIQGFDLIEQRMSQSTNWSVTNTLAYAFNVQQHKIDVLAGMSFEEDKGTLSLDASNHGSIFDDFEHAYISNTLMDEKTNMTMSGGPGIRSALASFFGRMNYNYAERYLFTGTLRYDGSSKFARGKRWGVFPSVSAGWVISEEDFAKSAGSWLNFFKLRASWGQNGNQAIPDFQYLSTIAYGKPDGNFQDIYPYDPTKQVIASGAYYNKMPNPNISWETSEQTDIGFDSRFLKNRLDITVDFYNKITRDWLVNPPALATLGYTNFAYINGGDVRNRGVEFEATWRDSAGDFKYSTGINFAINENEVTRIANEEGIIRGTGLVWEKAPESYRAQVGYPIGYFWGYKSLGIFQNQEQVNNYVSPNGIVLQPNAIPGDMIRANTNGDDQIDQSDKTMIGNPYPKLTMGLNINLGWKGIDFNFTGYAAFGHQIFQTYTDPYRYGRNVPAKYFGRWTGEGTSNKFPSVGGSYGPSWQDVSDMYVQNGDYFRAQVITLGYDFKSAFKRLPLEQLRIYVSGQNLFVITNYDGFDPEVGNSFADWSSGLDIGILPRPRTFLFGINIKY